MVVKALYQAMNVLTPDKPFLERGQVTQIAEEWPCTLEAFMTMSLYGLSSTRHSASVLPSWKPCCTMLYYV